jgi:hypothetical protein
VGLQISIRVSGDVTILDLRGRATIGADSELLRSYLRQLLAVRYPRLHLHQSRDPMSAKARRTTTRSTSAGVSASRLNTTIVTFLRRCPP